MLVRQIRVGAWTRGKYWEQIGKQSAQLVRQRLVPRYGRRDAEEGEGVYLWHCVTRVWRCLDQGVQVASYLGAEDDYRSQTSAVCPVYARIREVGSTALTSDVDADVDYHVLRLC